MDLTILLQNFGLNEKQSEVYLTLLQLGSSDIQSLTDESKLKRTTLYSVLDELEEKGLVYYTQKGSHRQYHAENPRKLPNLLAEENKQLLARQKYLIDAIPELASIYNVKLSKPRIYLYEGIEGLKKIYNEMLRLRHNQEILSFEQDSLMRGALLDLWAKDHQKHQSARKIRQRSIVEQSDLPKEKNPQISLINKKIIILEHDKFPFKNEINIFGNKVAIISFKEMLGVIIESGDVAKTLSSIFELAWLGAEKMKIVE